MIYNANTEYETLIRLEKLVNIVTYKDPPITELGLSFYCGSEGKFSIMPHRFSYVAGLDFDLIMEMHQELCDACIEGLSGLVNRLSRLWNDSNCISLMQYMLNNNIPMITNVPGAVNSEFWLAIHLLVMMRSYVSVTRVDDMFSRVKKLYFDDEWQMLHQPVHQPQVQPVHQHQVQPVQQSQVQPTLAEMTSKNKSIVKPNPNSGPTLDNIPAMQLSPAATKKPKAKANSIALEDTDTDIDDASVFSFNDHSNDLNNDNDPDNDIMVNDNDLDNDDDDIQSYKSYSSEDDRDDF